MIRQLRDSYAIHVSAIDARCDFGGIGRRRFAVVLANQHQGRRGDAGQIRHAEHDGPLVTFTKSGVSARWSSATPSLLDFAEEQGLFPDYSCRSGSCESCKTRVVSGAFDYPVEPFERPGEGYVLLCCARPTSDLELEV